MLLTGIQPNIIWLCSCLPPYCGFVFHVVFPWFLCNYPTSRTASLGNPVPAETWIFRGHTLITLKINPSNGHDYADIWEACFYTNTTTNLRGSDRSDASEACNDPGNVSSHSCTAVQHWRRTTEYMSARPCGCLAQHHPIDLGQKVVD